MPRLRAEDAERRRCGPPELSEALARGLAVIEAFGPERRQMTLADAARAVHLPRATVRRTLLTLLHLGFLESEGPLFRLTPRVLRLASAWLGANGVSALLQPACERIARETRELCSAAMLDGEEIVFVAYGQPSPLGGLSGMIGTRLPAFCTALGRVLLSALPDADLSARLDTLSPQALTGRTLTDPAAIRLAVLRARSDGYALCEEEAELGFRSIAVPLRRHDGGVVAVLNIGMPVARGPASAAMARLLPMLRGEAEALRPLLL